MRLYLHLFGGFEARLDSQPAALRLPKKAIGLLAFLASRPGRPSSRDKLAGLLWGDSSTEQARQSLRQALLSLRRALEEAAAPPVIVSEGDTLAFDPAQGEVDVAVFERVIAEADCGGLERAAALYRGEFLDGFHLNEVAFEEWAVAERERLRELAVESMARLLQHQHRASAIEPAIHTALRLLRLDHSQEVVHRTLIRLYARQGRRAEALRQYRFCVGVLRRELGIEPEPETIRVYRELVQPRSPSWALQEARAEQATRRA